MAVTGSDGSVILTTKVDESGINKGISSMGSGIAKFGATAGKQLLNLGATAVKAFAVIGAAAATATVAITKMAVSAYADYEQLVGGVETLFKDSSDKVVEYANQAFMTAGISANEYMQTVTSFSASLLSSLGGDTNKAADVANQALIDMSDNANKMGTSMELIQNAYQGFAKQNYTMLDNLKLGYGGTKTEMERLLSDAEKLTGQKYDISNLADVYNAIHAIQEELGIAGTTAKEAEKTITGSANMMKAAWQNVLSAIAGGGDLDRAINNLVYSIQKYFENIVPVVETALKGVGTLIANAAPLLVKTVARALINAIPSLLVAIYEMIIGLSTGIYQGIVDLFRGGTTETIEAQTSSLESTIENQNALTEAVEETADAQKKVLANFDTANVLSEGAETNVDTAEMVQGATGSGMINTIEEADKEVPAFVRRVIAYLEPLKKPFQDLWLAMKPDVAMLTKEFNYVKENVLKPMADYAVNEYYPTLTNAYTGAFESLKSAFSVIAKPLKDVFEKDIKPIFKDIGGWLVDIISQTSESFDYFGEKIKKFKDEIVTVIQGIGVIISVIWSVLKPILSAIVETVDGVLKTTIDWVFSAISGLAEFFNFFANIFNALKSLINGNTDDAVLYFKKALVNILNYFVTMANGAIAIVNNLWTLIFSALKGAVNGIAGLIEKIGEFIGEDWNLKWDANAPLIPEIPKYVPKLASGAVIPPNKEFMAVLGDQTSGRNLEAPESLIRQIVREESGGGNITIEAKGNMAQFLRYLDLELKRENKRASVF